MNANGRVRQYFPKGIRSLGDDPLRSGRRKLNRHPRLHRFPTMAGIRVPFSVTSQQTQAAIGALIDGANLRCHPYPLDHDRRGNSPRTRQPHAAAQH